jgi:hypothetical protein
MGFVMAIAADVAPTPKLYRRAVLLGLLPVLTAVALAVLSKECEGGPFDRLAVSSGFEAGHCELVIRDLGTGYQIKLPLPSYWQAEGANLL